MRRHKPRRTNGALCRGEVIFWGVWVLECLGAWVFGCLGAWVFECLGAALRNGTKIKV
jgi:hypothetical protein